MTEFDLQPQGHEFKDPFDTERGFINEVKKLRQGFKFLKSRHARRIQDTVKSNTYFVQCDMKASMEKTFYKVKVAISIPSGNVKLCQCQCKAQSLRRCCHVSGLLLHVWCHVRLNGFEGKHIFIIQRNMIKPLEVHFITNATSKILSLGYLTAYGNHKFLTKFIEGISRCWLCSTDLKIFSN